MADLTQALSGLNFAGTDSAFGIGQQALAQATPQLINPYGSTGQALGISLGSVLLQSLLGYQAQKSAMEDTLATNKLANAMLQLKTPEERTGFIETQATDPRIATRLSSLATALTGQQLARQNELALFGDKAIAQIKAEQQFYNTPEGQQAREFELNKIRAEAEARRTPLENKLAEIALRNEGALNVATLKEEGADRRTKLKIEADAGNKQAEQDFKREMSDIDKAFEQSMVEFKAKVGVNAAKEKAEQLAALEMRLLAQNGDPELARAEARAAITKQINEAAILAREESTKRLQANQTEEVKKRKQYEQQIQLENPKIPLALVTQNAKRVTAADMALGIADDLEKFANWTTYRIGTAFTAADEQLLRSRILKLTAEERLALSGTATNESERKDINQMLNGDFTAGPESKAALLRRFALDSKRIAVSNMKAGSQNVGSFVKAVEDSIANNTTTNFAVKDLSENNSTESRSQADAFVSDLKNRYGADWKTKMTASERQQAQLLVQQARR